MYDGLMKQHKYQRDLTCAMLSIFLTSNFHLPSNACIYKHLTATAATVYEAHNLASANRARYKVMEIWENVSCGVASLVSCAALDVGGTCSHLSSRRIRLWRAMEVS